MSQQSNEKREKMLIILITYAIVFM